MDLSREWLRRPHPAQPSGARDGVGDAAEAVRREPIGHGAFADRLDRAAMFPSSRGRSDPAAGGFWDLMSEDGQSEWMRPGRFISMLMVSSIVARKVGYGVEVCGMEG